MNKLNINGKEYPIIANWNVIGKFLKYKGSNDVADLANEDFIGFNDYPELIAICVNEANRMEKREQTVTAEDIGEELTMEHVAEFSKIFNDDVTCKILAVKSDTSKK